MSSLKGSKGLIASLASRPAALYRGLRDFALQRPVIAVLSCIGFFTVFSFVYYEKNPVLDFLNHEAQPGKILVNSPTVYTRQRLVNDRLDQAQWLRTQLQSTEINHEKDFRNIDIIRRTLTDTRVGAGSSQGDKSGHTNDDPAADRDVKVQSTTAALFRSKNAYREEVRSEITQTELDDRHDIEGNTIFRLTFDTSIIAGTTKDSIAAIVVRLSHHPETATGVSKDIYDEDYRSLYEEWSRYFQERLMKSMQSVPESFLNGGLPETPLRLLFTEFLLRRICQFVGGNPDLRDDPPNCDGEQRTKAEALLAEFTRMRGQLVEEFRNATFDESLRAKLAKLGSSEPMPGSETLRYAATSFCVRNHKSQISLSDLGIQPQRGQPPPFGSNDRGPNPPNPQFQSEYVLECPYYDSTQERLISGIFLYEAIFSILTRVEFGSENQAPPSSGDFDGYRSRISNQLSRLKCEIPGICNVQPSRLACFAADFLKSNLNAFAGRTSNDSGRKIDRFLTLRLVGRAVNDCTILVIPVPKTLDGQRDPELSNFLRYTFSKELNSRTDAFAYSVTPKALTENIAAAAETRDAFEVLFRIKGAPNDVANYLRKRSQQNHAVEAHPIVVGFGSLDPAERISASASSTGVRDIDLGWIIASRVQDDGILRQIDGQYPLTAFISVPAWWRSVEMSTHTCWISRKDFTAMGVSPSASDLCSENAKLQDSTKNESRSPAMVRLPPAIPEISHKLGFDVVRQPSIDNPRQHELVVGEHGSLLLEGERLWRSTMVTAGEQRATKIVVLPNMEGILAEFACVEPPVQGDSDSTGLGSLNGETQAPSAKVWTSEGVTTAIPLKYSWRNNWRESLAKCKADLEPQLGQNVQ